MKSKVLLLCVFGLNLFVLSCAHHRDVRPGADGIHRVVISTDNPDAATRDAISQANHYCKQSKREAAFINEEKKYTGDMDEQTYKNAKRATTVAKTVGGGVWALGGKRESGVGGVVGLGGVAGDAALGNGYTVEMKFKCQ